MIRLKRVYEEPREEDGERYLVDYIWPRGITKEAARLTAWMKDLAPSPALRRWFGHDPRRWEEFQSRYAKELEASEKQARLRQVADRARQGPVTLVYAARDTAHNNAVVLKGLLEEHLK